MVGGRKIEQRKRGTHFGFWFFSISLRTFGLRGAYGLLYFVCLYYLLFDREAVKGALAYVKRRFPGASGPSCRWHVYRLFISQGKQLIDRHAALTGAIDFEFELQGMEEMQEAIASSGRGLVLLTAHVGNWQTAMTTLKNMGKVVNLVMRPEDNPAVSKALSLSKNSEHLKVISAESELGGVVDILNALKRGEIVSFMGDRPFGFKALPVQFIGETAMFPCGPFQIAATAGCPLQILLSARKGYKKYLVNFTGLLLPDDMQGASPRDKIAQSMQAFAGRLNEFVEQYPYQCFLFTDVWKRDDKAA